VCPCLTTEATAEQQFRSGYPRALRLAFLLAVFVHVVLFVAVPGIEVAPYRLPPRPVIDTIAVPDYLVPPPPVEAPRRPMPLLFAPVEGGSEESTIGPTALALSEVLEPPPLREAPYREVFDSPPVVVTQVRPVYPELARQSELEGTVFVRIGVDEFGDVAWAEIVRGVPGLNEAALEAVRAWKFTPARQGDLPVRVRIVVPIRFVLRD
jgi:protein TonB